MPSKPSATARRARRLPWLALTLTLLVGLTALIPEDPIRDAANFGPVGDARLERGLGYAVLGPISSMFDAMTLFSVEQIIGFTLWAMGLYVVARVLRRRSVPVSWKRESIYAAASFITLILIYLAAVILPRPMAKLVVTRIDVIAVDFHSHTSYSHDGRKGWSAQDVRDWHTASGFNIAYITDHRTVEGAREGIQLDRGIVGEEPVTTLLPGIEAFYNGEHVNLLNANARFRGLLSSDMITVDDTALTFASLIKNNEPVLIETIPGKLDKIIPHAGPGSAGIRAIEIVAGSPRGMTQVKRDHDRIVHLADSLDLALVAGSDNHGWGRTAPGWTLLRVPNWRSYTTEGLANLIDEILRISLRRGTLVVERTTAGASPLQLAFTMPVVVWTVLRTLSGAERIAWLGWIWIPVIVAWFLRRRATTP